MKKTPAPQEAKTFPIKFTKSIIIAAIAVLILCVVGIGVSAYNIAKYGVAEFSDVLIYPFLILVSVFCIVVVVAVLIKSQYVVEDKTFITQFGFVKSKFAIKDFTAITLDTDTTKMTVNVGEEYFVLSLLKKEQNEELVRALLAVNPNIEYSFTFAETDGKNKKK